MDKPQYLQRGKRGESGRTPSNNSSNNNNKTHRYATMRPSRRNFNTSEGRGGEEGVERAEDGGQQKGTEGEEESKKCREGERDGEGEGQDGGGGDKLSFYSNMRQGVARLLQTEEERIETLRRIRGDGGIRGEPSWKHLDLSRERGEGRGVERRKRGGGGGGERPRRYRSRRSNSYGSISPLSFSLIAEGERERGGGGVKTMRGRARYVWEGITPRRGERGERGRRGEVSARPHDVGGGGREGGKSKKGPFKYRSISRLKSRQWPGSLSLSLCLTWP